MLSNLNTRVDIILLGYFVNDASVGIYSFAAVFAEGFGQISYVVKQNLDPIIGRFTAAKSIDKLRSLMRKVVLVFVPSILALSIVSALLFPVMRLQEIAARIGVSLIPTNRVYTRFINDSHANIEGNLRMAEDIFDFLITNEETSRVLRKAQQQNKGL